MSARQIFGAVGVTLGLGSAAFATTQVNHSPTATADVSSEAGRSRLVEELERELDPGALNWGATPPSSGQFVASDNASYLVTREGNVTELDPDETYAAKAQVDLGGVPGLAAVSGGRLIVPMADGNVKVVEGAEVVIDEAVGSPGDNIDVSLVGDSAVLVNQSSGELRRFDPQSGEMGDVLRPELPAGELLVPPALPSEDLWMFAGRSGHLVGVDLGSGEQNAVPVAGPDADILMPVALDDHLFLVDRSGGGSIFEVDPAASEPVVQTEALDLSDASQVDLVEQDGVVYVNDRAGNLAVVIEPGQPYERVDKSADPEAAETLPEAPGTPPGGEGDEPPPAPPVECSGEWACPCPEPGESAAPPIQSLQAAPVQEPCT